MSAVPADFLEVASLAVAAALQDDSDAVRLLLASLPPEQTAAACEGAVLAMAALLRDHLPPNALHAAITAARTTSQEGH
ncbi:hypothetical protein [Streptomyces sp. SID8499]|uniref:hypothetical protein n=1 Tax=Streptomyces sp. SID8499 TaxID=2706106 RepID=UPI0013CB1324|nr:hypothetical protein [Streptomyces sp. SID8499]NED31969.1 hypothetical protein [Streptomyces sp. SID8499]